jgi:hypothetical protein
MCTGVNTTSNTVKVSRLAFEGDALHLSYGLCALVPLLSWHEKAFVAK